MKCKNCGEENSEYLNFCKSCGDPLITYNQNKEVVEEINLKEMYGKEYLNKNKKRSIFLFLTFLSLLLIFIGVFLPFFQVDGKCLNYVYSTDTKKVLFGSFVAGISFISLILLLLQKKIPVIILQLLATGIFVYDLISNANLRNFQYGFIVFSVGLFISTLCSIIRIFSKRYK